MRKKHRKVRALWTRTDERYWLETEERVKALLVDLSEFGFVTDPWYFKRGWSANPSIRVRQGVAEALVRARKALPARHNFKIIDGWRSWETQKCCAKDALAQLRKAHPGWTEKQIRARRAEVAPPIRFVPWFDSHRYGGAVDLTIVDPQGRDLDMGVPIDYVTGPESALLWYEMKAGSGAGSPSDLGKGRGTQGGWEKDAKERAGRKGRDGGARERVFRDNRRLLIRAMTVGGFSANLVEWWHWGMHSDVAP